ncbi:4Fe-4S dicluster domain-containing protein, partial [bacterium]|nr:4Fe-4S dicluster domain-containing protein [bacterium]
VAQTISRYLKNEVSKENLSEYYNDTIFSGPAGKELYRVRNIHQTFHFGAPIGAATTGLNWITNHLLPFGRLKSKGDSNQLKPLKSFLSPPKFTLAEAGAEDKLQQESRNFLKDWIPAFASLASSARRARMTSEEIPEPLDKSESVYLSGTIHREDQPCHCKLEDDKLCLDCKIEYGQPCLRFCPGGVYEKDPNVEDKIFVNFSNCVHCKTCEIKCPKDNLTWTLPEGGEGPHYRRM